MTLHDQELRIIDVELDRAEQVFDVLLTFILAIYLGFGRTVLYRLSYSDLIAVSQSHTRRTLRLIGVVQDQSDRCPFDSSCPAFVDQLLLVVNSDVFEGRNAHHEAYCVEYVRFPGAVQSIDGIELAVKLPDQSFRGIRLEPINYDLLNVHI